MTGIARLTEYLWQYWRRYLLGGLSLVGTTSLLMLVPWWIRAAIQEFSVLSGKMIRIVEEDRNVQIWIDSNPTQ